MASFSNVVIVGNLTRDVELNTVATKNGDKQVADITVAVDDGYGENKAVSFIDVTLWGQPAKFASDFMGKGWPVLVHGTLKQETWEKDGQRRSKIKIVGNTIKNLRPKKVAEEMGLGTETVSASQPSFDTSEPPF